ncbi:PREDICTED: uncharacterized protein LOC104605134 [Nelumbo nucifera]|uniref:Uncharacterized protein LOC104605134 n=1 Tax=Nelumbo nucifera TaxID=4432 RepID=A0A1U8AL61_NELNU|nr:PREDICTED: uncharacterized protein LOC104605134 [Nelumbo nucifera]
MAITHADLAPSRPSTDLGSKTGAFFLIVSILCGLVCFILCLLAETTRSDVTWVPSSSDKRHRYVCIYSGSGRTTLLCAGGAFLSLAIAMIVQHAYILVAVSKYTPPVLIGLSESDSRFAKSLSWQAGFFFLTTWICFAVAEVLLLIGLGAESGHLEQWRRPRTSCLIIREGLFSAAGVLGLTTVLLASGLYLTALRAQRFREQEDNVRREVLNASFLYASPPRSPRNRIGIAAANSIAIAAGAGNPHVRQEQHDHHRPLQWDPQPSTNKTTNPVPAV